MIPAISGALSALGPQAAISATGTASPASATHSTSFGSQLSSALGSLDQSQQSAATASQGLATGTISDPTQAVTAVENASLAMDLASQVRDKLIAAENTIFTTQV